MSYRKNCNCELCSKVETLMAALEVVRAEANMLGNQALEFDCTAEQLARLVSSVQLVQELAPGELTVDQLGRAKAELELDQFNRVIADGQAFTATQLQKDWDKVRADSVAQLQKDVEAYGADFNTLNTASSPLQTQSDKPSASSKQLLRVYPMVTPSLKTETLGATQSSAFMKELAEVIADDLSRIVSALGQNQSTTTMLWMPYGIVLEVEKVTTSPSGAFTSMHASMDGGKTLLKISRASNLTSWDRVNNPYAIELTIEVAGFVSSYTPYRSSAFGLLQRGVLKTIYLTLDSALSSVTAQAEKHSSRLIWPVQSPEASLGSGSQLSPVALSTSQLKVPQGSPGVSMPTGNITGSNKIS